MRTKLLFLSMAGAVLLLGHGTAFAQERVTPVISTILPNPTFSFGMIGLGTGQTARLNVVNLVRTPPPIAISLFQPCKVELDLYDGQGKLIKQKSVTNLGFGQADFLDLLRSELNTTSTHVDVTAVVKVGSNQSFTCNIGATLEVFDNVTGASTVILAGTNSSGFAFSILPPSPATGQQ